MFGIEDFEILSKKQKILTEGLWDATKALVAANVSKQTQKDVLIITGESKEENRLFDDISFFYEGKLLEFPAWETLPSENLPPSYDIVGERYTVLGELLYDPSPKIILTTVQACLQQLITPQKLKNMWCQINLGDEIPFTELQQKLVAMGYRQRPLATDKGEFAIRGGIIDIFVVASPDPVRLEFWGDEIASIRLYDPIGQKSIHKIESVTITPAQELELLNQQKEISSLVEYLAPETTIIFDNIEAIEDRYVFLENIPGTISKNFISFHDFLSTITKHPQIYWSPKEIGALCDSAHKTAKNNINFKIFDTDVTATHWQHPFVKLSKLTAPEGVETLEHGGEEFLLNLSQLPQTKYTIKFVCANESEEQHLKQQLEELEISLPATTKFISGYLSTGFNYGKEVLVPYAEITHRYKIRRQKRRGTYHTSPLSLSDLQLGDFVVHINHGVGRYKGIELLPNHIGIETEFLVVEYEDDAKLYIPLTQSHLVSKYIGSKEEEKPRLHSIGGSRWQKTRIRTERAINDYASQLLQLYAERSVSNGYTYPKCSDEALLFEKDFPYTETDDQEIAIAAIKDDMIEGKTMDRLICGDVGYGKTEVAMRAAFKTVVDGNKQVAVLVPTTILAMQHFDNFVERMAPYPVVIKCLSRFQTPKESKQIIENVSRGAVDILIGTHRILSKDVYFKDLGLLIIDEEQRFGVKAKEKLKATKANINCLTMTATPIPRTLYLSLAGARDMSPINTPPQDRLPIKTIVHKKDDAMIKNALLRELSRDGQTYIIHNRVETIFRFASEIQKMVPDARILVAHGRMSANEIEDIFHTFRKGQGDILVATTILENGVDVPNANTIIIDRADRFGLADLYQLRGRVGRWNRQAYAYFLTPERGSLNPTAQRRLDVLHELQGYGGGMKLALRDLEIRGTGNILGTEQSGHISSIGFHLYCKLLQRAIANLQGKAPPPLLETKLELPYDARIPENYVYDPGLRMDLYQRLGEATDTEAIDTILAEMQDRFGSPPKEVIWLYHIMRIRAFSNGYRIIAIKLQGNVLTLQQYLKGKTTTKTATLDKIRTPKNLEDNITKVIKSCYEPVK